MNDIWHTSKEKPMLHTDIILCGDGWSMPIDIIPETVNNICWENVEKWCYLDDLLACEKELADTKKKLEQSEICCTEWEKQALDYKAETIVLQSKLNIAVDALEYANKCIKGGCVNWETHIDKALEQIKDKEN